MDIHIDIKTNDESEYIFYSLWVSFADIIAMKKVGIKAFIPSITHSGEVKMFMSSFHISNHEPEMRSGNLLSYKVNNWDRVDLPTLPWHFPEIIGGRVFFFEKEEKAKKLIYTEMKLGRYLTKYYPELDKNTITRIVSETDFNYDLHIATSEEEIVDVYERGPSSCMGKTTSSFGLIFKEQPIHPVVVYAAGDLGVAYLKKGNSIFARAIVDVNKKKFLKSFYGDGTRLKNVLYINGYMPSDYLDGAKIKKIRLSHARYLMPYIDNHCVDDYDDEHFVLREDGEYCCDEIRGYISI